MKRARSPSPTTSLDRNSGAFTSEALASVYKHKDKRQMGARYSKSDGVIEHDGAEQSSAGDNMRVEVGGTQDAPTGDNDQQQNTADAMSATEEHTDTTARGPPVLPPLPFERLSIEGKGQPLEQTTTTTTAAHEPPPTTPQNHPTSSPPTPTTPPNTTTTPIHWITYTTLLPSPSHSTTPPTGTGFTTCPTLISTATHLTSHPLIQQRNLRWRVRRCEVAAADEQKVKVQNGGTVEMKGGAWATVEMYNAVMEMRDWVGEREELEAWEKGREKERGKEGRRGVVRKGGRRDLRGGEVEAPMEMRGGEKGEGGNKEWEEAVRVVVDGVGKVVRERAERRTREKQEAKEKKAVEKSAVERTQSWEWDDETRAKYVERVKRNQEKMWEQARRSNMNDK